ncbi:MAG: rod-binding protein [Alphaproteobacteria bacterium]|nr:rod-binding protein [Alphaproteobacteria bacterium]
MDNAQSLQMNNMLQSDAIQLRAKSMQLRGAPKATEAQIAAKAEEFEAVFLSQMLSHMFDGIETNELFGGGAGEDTYKSMLVEQYGSIIAKTGGVGVADHVKAEMLRLQEMQP